MTYRDKMIAEIESDIAEIEAELVSLRASAAYFAERKMRMMAVVRQNRIAYLVGCLNKLKDKLDCTDF